MNHALFWPALMAAAFAGCQAPTHGARTQNPIMLPNAEVTSHLWKSAQLGPGQAWRIAYDFKQQTTCKLQETLSIKSQQQGANAIVLIQGAGNPSWQVVESGQLVNIQTPTQNGTQGPGTLGNGTMDLTSGPGRLTITVLMAGDTNADQARTYLQCQAPFQVLNTTSSPHLLLFSPDSAAGFGATAGSAGIVAAGNRSQTFQGAVSWWAGWSSGNTGQIAIHGPATTRTLDLTPNDPPQIMNGTGPPGTWTVDTTVARTGTVFIAVTDLPMGNP